MEIVLFAVLSVLGAAFILHPLFVRGRSAVPRAPRVEGDEARVLLLAEKDTVYDDLKDIEFEFETGKLSEDDYAELRQAYRVRALDVLERIGEPTTSPAPRCPACGERSEAGASYCAACGASLSRSDVCRSCGAEFDAEDRFCGTCGGARSGVSPAAVS